MAFSPDGQTLAVGAEGEDWAVWSWDVATGRTRSNTFLGHTGGGFSVAFSPDGRTLATAGDDGIVRLWDVSLLSPDEAMRKIRRALHRDFTMTERSLYLPDRGHSPVCPQGGSA